MVVSTALISFRTQPASPETHRMLGHLVIIQSISGRLSKIERQGFAHAHIFGGILNTHAWILSLSCDTA